MKLDFWILVCGAVILFIASLGMDLLQHKTMLGTFIGTIIAILIGCAFYNKTKKLYTKGEK